MSSENRRGMTPAVVLALTKAGHDVFVETKAGEGSGFTDGEYAEAGATITLTAKEAWAQEMIMKVKDPLPEEFDYFYEGLVIFAYFHLAADKELGRASCRERG